MPKGKQVGKHIDNLEQLTWLKSLDAGYGQGWQFAKASDAIDPQGCFGHELQTDDLEVACEAVIGLGEEKVCIGYRGDL